MFLSFAAAGPLQLDTTQGTGLHTLTFKVPATYSAKVASLSASPAQALVSNASVPDVTFNSTLAQIGQSATATIRELNFHNHQCPGLAMKG